MPVEKKFLMAWFVVINLLGIIIVCMDKRRAKQHRWRIRERTLFFFALLGGTLGVYFTMLLIRHKTQHKRFMIGLPLILLAQILLMILLTFSF